MTKKELHKVSDILNSCLGNYLHEKEVQEVNALFKNTVEKSGLIKSEEHSRSLLDAWLEENSNKSKKCLFSNNNYTEEERKILCMDCEEECSLKNDYIKFHKIKFIS